VHLAENIPGSENVLESLAITTHLSTNPTKFKLSDVPWVPYGLKVTAS